MVRVEFSIVHKKEHKDAALMFLQLSGTQMGDLAL